MCKIRLVYISLKISKLSNNILFLKIKVYICNIENFGVLHIAPRIKGYPKPKVF